MRISSFNINKFCGPYSNKGCYYNPRNIDFRTTIKKIVQSSLKNKDDIFFLQEFVENKYIGVLELFSEEEYKIHGQYKTKSNVVAITLKENNWNVLGSNQESENAFTNKIITMTNVNKNLFIVSFQDTDKNIIKKRINECFENNKIDIILGDFNASNWIDTLKENNNFRDLVTNDMITFKPAQTTIDHIFIRNKEAFNNKVVFNGVTETYASDHNLLSFYLNI